MKFRPLLALIAASTLTGALAVSVPAAQATPDPSPPPVSWAMPSEIPSATTPGITKGTKVTQLAEVGDKVFAAGSFKEVGGQARAGVAAFNRATGALDQTFNPTILGEVYAVTPGATPNTIYVAGILRNVNGVPLSKVALLNATTGAPISGFKPPTINAVVNDLKYRAGNLYVAGNFTQVGSTPRGGLASLNPTTGALTDALTVGLTEHHNTDPNRVQKPVGGFALDVSKDGSRLVVIGNFRKANGLDRDQAVQIDLTGTASSINAWQTDRFKPLCYNWANDSTVRSVALSPDDSYFVIGAGGGGQGTLCDTASKWRSDNPVTGAQPEWVASAGGDTIWGVAVSDNAVYVGGHQRWMNNPTGNDYAGPGAVPRSGLSVLDPLSGVPMKWNPGRVPRGTAVFGMLVARDGVWIGSDTDYISVNPAYKRQKLAFFPYDGGYTATPTTTPKLPATVYVGRDALSSWNFDGTTAGSETLSGSAIDWSTIRGSFTVGNKLYLGTAGTLKVASFNGKTIGTPSVVNPYHDPKWMNWPNGSGGTYDGATPPFYSQLSSVTGMFYNQGFLYYANGGSALQSLPFSADSGIVSPIATTVSSSMSFADVSGMFVDGSTLYFVKRSTGDLYSTGWTGKTTTGSATLVNGPNNGGLNWNGRALFLGNAEANKPPTASFTSSCIGLTCSLDASASTDPDGTITNWSWALGDGTTDSGVTLGHTYAAAGPVTVTLTVTDNSGATTSTTKTVQPVAVPSDSGFIAQSGTDDRSSTVKSMPVPAQAQTGDTLLLHWVGDPASVPADPAGWTKVTNESIGAALATVAWTKQAGASDLGTTVSLTQPVARRTTAQLLVYRGYAGVAESAKTTDSGTATHLTPSQSVLTGDFVVSLFADRSTGTTSWTPAAGQSARGSALGTSTTRYSTFVSDPGAPTSGGTDPGTSATVNAPSLKGIGMSVVLRP